MQALAERLFAIFRKPDFLAMKGYATETPIYIQPYKCDQEDEMRRMVASLSTRLHSSGISLNTIDLFDMVLNELAQHNILEDLISGETTYKKNELLETLQNYSDPKRHLVPRLVQKMSENVAQLTLITGSGRIFPFLRTHSILESLQPAMFRHPVVIFFPGEYTQNSKFGSHLRLFGSIPMPSIANPYYRALNLMDYKP